MAFSLTERIKNAFNAFNRKEPVLPFRGSSISSWDRPDRGRLSYGNASTIMTPILERIAIDGAAIDIHHAHVDENGNYLDDVDSGINHILTVEANIDQSARAFMQDVILKLFDSGVVALVPIETDTYIPNEPGKKEKVDVITMRAGTITEWFPKHVRVKVYNEETGDEQEIVLPKEFVGIIENPFYAVMNDSNSIVKRLTRKLELIDVIDEKAGSTKLNMILKFPYQIRSEAQKDLANARLKQIETQLETSKYGMAWVDGTEDYQTIGGSVENNLFEQVKWYTEMLYSQLGITKGVMDGTANEEEMVNYFNRTLEPVLGAIVEELDRKFITKKAHKLGQTIVFYRDPFKLATADKMADMADRYSRNEILSPNELRGKIGFKPSMDPSSNELRNRNISPMDYAQANMGYGDTQNVPESPEAIPGEY